MANTDEAAPEWSTLLGVPWPATIVEAASAAQRAFQEPTQRTMVGVANLFERMPAIRSQLVALTIEAQPDPSIAQALALAMVRFGTADSEAGLGASMAMAANKWEVAAMALGRSDTLDEQIVGYALRLAPVDDVRAWLSSAIGNAAADTLIKRSGNG